MADSFSLWTPWRIIDTEAGPLLHDDRRNISLRPEDPICSDGGSAREAVKRMASGEFAGWLDEPLVRRFTIRE